MNRQKTALISVARKDGIDQFAKTLVDWDWNIISSGGTAKHLKDAGVPVTDVAEISGLPPVLDHRVVTLVPAIHGGLLATEEMLPELEQYGWPWINLCCVDFYPLKNAVENPSATETSVINETDIGGPAMARSAAQGRRVVIVDPADRQTVLDWMKNGYQNEALFRRTLAAKAEAIVADYCLTSAIFHSAGKITGHINGWWG